MPFPRNPYSSRRSPYFQPYAGDSVNAGSSGRLRESRRRSSEESRRRAAERRARQQQLADEQRAYDMQMEAEERAFGRQRLLQQDQYGYNATLQEQRAADTMAGKEFEAEQNRAAAERANTYASALAQQKHDFDIEMADIDAAIAMDSNAFLHQNQIELEDIRADLDQQQTMLEAEIDVLKAYTSMDMSEEQKDIDLQRILAGRDPEMIRGEKESDLEYQRIARGEDPTVERNKIEQTTRAGHERALTQLKAKLNGIENDKQRNAIRQAAAEKARADIESGHLKNLNEWQKLEYLTQQNEHMNVMERNQKGTNLGYLKENPLNEPKIEQLRGEMMKVQTSTTLNNEERLWRLPTFVARSGSFKRK